MRKKLLIILLLAIGSAAAGVAQSSSLTLKEQLGKKLFFDKISSPANSMSCATCHAPSTGFTGPVAGINLHGAVYRGAAPQRFGNRKPPSSAYVTFSPVFYDAGGGFFIGGNFWDGRATGARLGSPAAEQALGPFLNPVEQNNPSKKAVLQKIAASNYAWMWQPVWGTPLQYSTQAQIDMNYDRVGLAIAAYEASSEVNQFSSKYDYYLQGLAELTAQEAWGLELFDGKGKCSACHVSEVAGDEPYPLFTDFTFDNLGVPKNPENPFYDMDRVFVNGQPINPLGDAWIDYGLGEFLANSGNAAWEAMAAANLGKHKVPTLRNVDKRPGNGFPKAYMHNGVFKSLKEVVHFYNTRDVVSANWPPPEVAANVNTAELGNLGLTNAEEDAIVAFMKTLSDGYVPSQNRLPGTMPFDAPASELSLDILEGNPFGEATRLAYYLPEKANVQLDVFSLSGEKVRTVVSTQQDEGRYEVGLAMNGLGSGIYIVRLQAGNQMATKKVVLVK
ncbi:MAG: T9SS type A sorting domain-containing protein [Phaeodactylibacter sp.]|nr:T9SS type A sorting domain-containing protein [Phaeodactylibacter sp.]